MREFMATKKQAKTAAAPAKIKIQYYRSTIAFPKTQKEIVRSLGSQDGWRGANNV